MGLGWHGLESDPSCQKQVPNLALMKVGDVLIAKQMNSDFKTMLVKAIGVVTEPSVDSTVWEWTGSATSDRPRSRSQARTGRR